MVTYFELAALVAVALFVCWLFDDTTPEDR